MLHNLLEKPPFSVNKMGMITQTDVEVGETDADKSEVGMMSK